MRLIFIFFTLLFLTSCTSEPKSSAPANTKVSSNSAASSSSSVVTKKPIYTANETARLGLCVALTDNAFSIAKAKLKGTAAKMLRDEYAAKPMADLTVPLVDKIYTDKFTHAWDYSVSFYQECATNLAQVAQPKSDTASYCMQNALIARIAKDNKDTGVSKEATQEYFNSFNSETPRKIVDEVYLQKKSREDTVRDTWNSCVVF